ncbi:hypothetical protein [Planctellipticum variicoloris]
MAWPSTAERKSPLSAAATDNFKAMGAALRCSRDAAPRNYNSQV